MSAIDSFRAAVLADPAVRTALAAEQDAARFAARALEYAAAQAIALTPDDLRAATPPIDDGALPPREWLPVMADGETVHWLYFGAAPLLDPFFAESAERAAGLPFARKFVWRTSLDTLLAAPQPDGIAPAGFIFHMSRCGSTLVTQMLAGSEQNIVIAEAEAVDAIVRAQLPPDRHVAALRAIVTAYGRNRTGKARRCFVKLDSWHSFALPLFRRAFPGVPWVFIYRDPVEVLVSHAQRPGRQTTPGVTPAELCGTDGTGKNPLSYYGLVLSRICESALAHPEGGLFVNYRHLPDALFDRVLPHFGVRPGRAETLDMAGPAMRNAKQPHSLFLGDSDAKQAAATPNLRAAAQHYLGDLYAQL
jgi:hypothetical protein